MSLIETLSKSFEIWVPLSMKNYMESTVNHVDLILRFHAITVAERKKERKKEKLMNKKTELA